MIRMWERGFKNISLSSQVSNNFSIILTNRRINYFCNATNKCLHSFPSMKCRLEFHFISMPMFRLSRILNYFNWPALWEWEEAFYLISTRFVMTHFQWLNTNNYPPKNHFIPKCSWYKVFCYAKWNEKWTFRF